MSLSIVATKDVDQAFEILSAKPRKAVKDHLAEEPHHFFICGTNLMAEILSNGYPTVTFLKWDPELQ